MARCSGKEQILRAEFQLFDAWNVSFVFPFSFFFLFFLFLFFSLFRERGEIHAKKKNTQIRLDFLIWSAYMYFRAFICTFDLKLNSKKYIEVIEEYM